MGRTLNLPTPVVRDITAVVPVNKGGTGASDAVTAATNLGAISKTKIGQPGGVATLNSFGRIPTAALPASIAPDVTLSGSKSLYLSQVATFTISNYDASTTYTVSASAGTISRNGATITYTAPGVAGDYTLTVNGRVVTVNVSAVRPAKPTLTATTSGEGTVTATAYLTGSAFAMQTGSGTHLSSDWEIYTDIGLTTLFASSLNDVTNKIGFNVSGMAVNTAYFARVRYRDSTGGLSDWSTTVVIQTKATYVFSAEEAKMVMPVTEQVNTASESWFWKTVYLDSTGTRVAVASPTGALSGSGTPAQGRVYIFKRTGSTWAIEATLSASDPASADYFGNSVAFDSDATRCIVGAWAKSGTYTYQGAAYVYVRTGTTWAQEQKIANPSPSNSLEYFGWTTVMDSTGTRVAIAAHGKDSTLGTVYTYTRSGVTWSLEATITAATRVSSAYFGSSLSMTPDGTRLAIGAYQDTAGATTTAGAVYVYLRTGSTWAVESKLIATDPVSGSYFGGQISIAADGSRVVIGAQQSTVTSLSQCGAVYVFSRSGTAWSQEQKITASDKRAGDMFGSSVAISSTGNTVLVGAYRADYNSTTDAGEVYVFTRNGTTWTESKILIASDSAATRGFGTSVHISSDSTRAVAYSRHMTGTYFLAAYVFTAG